MLTFLDVAPHLENLPPATGQKYQLNKKIQQKRFIYSSKAEFPRMGSNILLKYAYLFSNCALIYCLTYTYLFYILLLSLFIFFSFLS